jgi:glycosyltransferase involved in cell wall biosynthesis
MSVTFVASTPTFGGAERYMLNLASAFRQGGTAVRLLGEVPYWDSSVGPQIPLGLGAKWDGRAPLEAIRGIGPDRARFKARANKIHKATFHVQYKREQILYSRHLSRIGPVYWTEHGRFRRSLRSIALRLMYAKASRNLAGIVCVSSEVADDVSKIVARDVDVCVIPNAVDTKRMQPATEIERLTARKQLGLPANATVALWIGQMHPGKLPMLAAEVSQYLPGHMMLVGSGPLENDVRTYSARTPNLHFRPFMKDPMPAFRAADVLVFTSTGHGEGLPTVILESAAHGLPVIANYECGVERIVGECGGIVTRKSPRAIAEAVRLQAGSKKARTASRSWAERHDVQDWVRSHRAAMGLNGSRLDCGE